MKKLSVIMTTALAFVLVGCSNTTQDKAGSDKSVTISNYENKKGSTEFSKVETTFEKIPEKIFVNTKPAAEILLHLGLQDRIVGVGADFGQGDETVAKEYAKLPKVSTDYVGKELALSVNPDLIYGRGTLFSEEEWGNGSVESLKEMSVPSFILGSSIQGGTFESIYDDIERTGTLFGVENKAKEFSTELKEKEAAIKKTIGTHDKADFAYLHMSTPDEIMVYSASKETFFQSVFEMLNLNNIFKDVEGEVSLESLIKADPEYLIVPDWSAGGSDGVSDQDLIDSLMKDPRLQEMQAIKNKKVYGLDYNAMFGYGYQSLEGVEQLAKKIYG